MQKEQMLQAKNIAQVNCKGMCWNALNKSSLADTASHLDIFKEVEGSFGHSQIPKLHHQINIMEMIT